nr:octapeptide-repeat protein T2-like [Anolis sagrei ordinatus]
MAAGRRRKGSLLSRAPHKETQRPSAYQRGVEKREHPREAEQDSGRGGRTLGEEEQPARTGRRPSGAEARRRGHAKMPGHRDAGAVTSQRRATRRRGEATHPELGKSRKRRAKGKQRDRRSGEEKEEQKKTERERLRL